MEELGKLNGHNPDMLVDIVNGQGIPMEAPMPLADARAKRRGYRSFHVWVLRETDGGRIEALLRHSLSDSNSGGSSFDVAVRGVVPAGEGWVVPALRKVESDLGLIATTDDIRFAGKLPYSNDLTIDGTRILAWNLCAVYFILYRRRDAKSARLSKDLPGMSWIPLGDFSTKRGAERLLCHDVRRQEAAWILKHPSPDHKPPVARFSVTAGPATLFKRVRLVVSPGTSVVLLEHDYYDRAVRFRPALKRKSFCAEEEVYKILSYDYPLEWNLVGAEVRTDTGRFIRSHWNIRHAGKWYRLVLDGRGNIYNLKHQPDPTSAPFRHIVIDGPAWDYVSRVNLALMDAAQGFDERSAAIANGSIIVP